jgi:uncharacterized protein (TIGR00661 family)
MLEAIRCAGMTKGDMKILYGIVGEGMGHATRSKVILDELCAQGHEIAIVVSGRAHAFITRQFAARPNVTIEEIHGLTLDYDNNELDLSDSVLQNLKSAVPGLARNIEVYREIAERRFRPDAVISDFESWAYLYGMRHHLPVISIDNMQILNRCTHAADVTGDNSFSYKLAKWAVKVKLPRAYHYLHHQLLLSAGPQAPHDAGAADPAAGNPRREAGARRACARLSDGGGRPESRGDAPDPARRISLLRPEAAPPGARAT